VIVELPSIDPVQAALGGRLRRIRQARGFSVHELADETRITAARLGLGEQGRVRLSSVELHALMTALHIPIRLLFEPAADLSALRRL
jgi:transcriptional regulator with XRE-family HTH domain